MVDYTKEFLRFLTAGLLLAIGVGMMLFPFIPFGFVLVFAALALLSPYIWWIRRLLRELEEQDSRIKKAEYKSEKWLLQLAELFRR